MHSFLRAVGFSKLRNKKDLDLLLEKCLATPKRRYITSTGSDTSIVQIYKSFGPGIGISVIGEYAGDNIINIEHVFPYCDGHIQTFEDEIHIEKHSYNESYAGACEDFNIGVSLIFYVQNIADYIREKWLNEYAKVPVKVRLSALSLKGNILLNINKTPLDIEKSRRSNMTRTNLLAAAKAGDIDAMENLTIEDMDTYTVVSRRAKREDIYTIVESYFMPYGIETEQYSVLGNIISVDTIKNSITEEIVYDLGVDCNNIKLDIYINSVDLVGEPQIGRRFKGNIWLQGHVQFHHNAPSEDLE